MTKIRIYMNAKKSDLLNILINVNINKRITTNIYNLIIR